ncbi:hypothetical protein CR513_05528, partial [Mucuna pruriens]
MCLMIMKCSILEVFCGSISESQSARRFLGEIEQSFAKKEKVEMSNLLAKLILMKYKGRGNIREYIMEMSNLATKLKSLKLELGENFILHLRDKTENAHFASTSQNKKRKNIKGVAKISFQQKISKKDKEFTKYFCKKLGHMNKQCPKYTTSVPKDTWWVDFGATTHISVTMQVVVEAIGTFQLQLKTRFYLDLFETFVVLSFRKNLISISSLDKFGFFCSFGNNKVIMFIDDYSRYGYLYLIHEKSQSQKVFKSFKAKVELQLGKKIKAIKFDCGGEYYGRYDGSREEC